MDCRSRGVYSFKTTFRVASEPSFFLEWLVLEVRFERRGVASGSFDPAPECEVFLLVDQVTFLLTAVLVIVSLWNIHSSFGIVASTLLLSESASFTTTSSTLHTYQSLDRGVSSLFGKLVLLCEIAWFVLVGRLIVFEESCFFEQAHLDCWKRSEVTVRRVPQIPWTDLLELQIDRRSVVRLLAPLVFVFAPSYNRNQLAGDFLYYKVAREVVELARWIHLPTPCFVSLTQDWYLFFVFIFVFSPPHWFLFLRFTPLVWDIPPILIGLGSKPHPHIDLSFPCFGRDGFQNVLCKLL